MGSEEQMFNKIFAVYATYLEGRAVLNTEDEATHFYAASFLETITAETGNALARYWSRTYLGPPDFIRIDQGTNFSAKELSALVPWTEL
jgi:hypothetical protein